MSDSIGQPTPSGFDRNAATIVHRRRLPHLAQERVIYFITFRLADSIPQATLKQWRSELDAWLRLNPPPHTSEQEGEYADIGYRRIERWLDQGTGACVLASAAVQDEVERCLRHADGAEYALGDFVIMPNHVHALACIARPDGLVPAVRAWKSVTTHRINRILGRRGQLWQEDWFDHIVRNGESLERIRTYIRRNAASVPDGKARLGCGRLFGTT